MNAIDRIYNALPRLALAGTLTAAAVLAWGRYYQAIGLAVCEVVAVLSPAPCAPGPIPDPQALLAAAGELPPDPADADADAGGGGDEEKRFVVRLQAQGGGLQESVTFNQATPVTRSQAVQGLGALRSRLTRRELQARTIALQRAEAWINNVAAAGGTGPPGRSGFTNPGVRGRDARIDVEILSGHNLVPP